MIGGLLVGRETVDVPCTIDVEHTPDSLHAYVDLQGVEVGPGDEVVVHGAPVDVGFGEHVVCQGRATVTRAGWLDRMWTQLTGHLELTELYEVSFTDTRRL
jgi:hypothetical protein